VDYYGGQAVYLSGFRTRREQVDLWNAGTGLSGSRRPVAKPGCSQHEYGMAVDVTFVPGFKSIGIPPGLPLSNVYPEFAESIASLVGLQTVSGDRGHFQVFPGTQFGSWAIASGFCDPNPRSRGVGFLRRSCSPQDRPSPNDLFFALHGTHCLNPGQGIFSFT